VTPLSCICEQVSGFPVISSQDGRVEEDKGEVIIGWRWRVRLRRNKRSKSDIFIGELESFN
ncbi:SOS3-interacting protein 1, partial [Prunus dulcis]